MWFKDLKVETQLCKGNGTRWTIWSQFKQSFFFQTRVSESIQNHLMPQDKTHCLTKIIVRQYCPSSLPKIPLPIFDFHAADWLRIIQVPRRNRAYSPNRYIEIALCWYREYSCCGTGEFWLAISPSTNCLLSSDGPRPEWITQLVITAVRQRERAQGGGGNEPLLSPGQRKPDSPVLCSGIRRNWNW
jgi:hypothetical protein